MSRLMQDARQNSLVNILKLRKIAAALIAATIPLTEIRSANAEWITEAKFSCSDPIIIRNQWFILKWLKKPYNLSELNPDRAYLEISQREFNDKNLLFKTFEFGNVKLDADMAQVMRLFLESRARGVDFPFWSQQLPSIPALVLNATQGLAFSAAFAIFFDKLGAKKAELNTLEYMVADGGHVKQYGSVDFVGSNAVLTEMTNYEVEVGKEIRKFTLYTCLYPAKIVMTKLKTTSPSTNPKLFERLGTEWHMINADTNALERRYSFLNEDREFYYLKEIGGFGSEIRLSRTGGHIERSLDDTWAILYSETEVLQ